MHLLPIWKCILLLAVLVYFVRASSRSKKCCSQIIARQEGRKSSSFTKLQLFYIKNTIEIRDKWKNLFKYLFWLLQLDNDKAAMLAFELKNPFRVAQPNLQFIHVNAISWICMNDIKLCNVTIELGYCHKCDFWRFNHCRILDSCFIEIWKIFANCL